MEKGNLSNLYVSREAIEDIRQWGVDQIDETTKQELWDSIMYIPQTLKEKAFDYFKKTTCNEHAFELRGRTTGIYAEMIVGAAVLDNRRVVMADFS